MASSNILFLWYMQKALGITSTWHAWHYQGESLDPGKCKNITLEWFTRKCISDIQPEDNVAYQPYAMYWGKIGQAPSGLDYRSIVFQFSRPILFPEKELALNLIQASKGF